MMRSLSLLVLLVTIISCSEQKKDILSAEGSSVKVGEVIGRNTIKAHTTDTFKLNLSKDAIIYGYADQHDVDLVVKVYGPDNKEIGSFDEPARGRENFKFNTSTDGIYKVAVTPFQENSGEYSFTITNAEALATEPDKRIEQAVRGILGAEEKTPGVSIAVQRDGKNIFSRGFGYADLEQNAKVTPNTIFHVASVSKQFTCFAIAMLADQGKLNVNDDIRKYLPEMHDFGTPITINHLIHHTSGLRDQWSLLNMAGWRYDDVITTNHVMKIMSKQTELNYPPGNEYLYSNSGFTMMGEIVHRVTGETFPDWCKKNIFDPIGMKNTIFFDDHELVVENRSNSYKPGSNGFRKSILSYANAGATSLFTTPEDLNLWALNFESKKVGGENVMNMMNTRFVLNNGDTITYAYGQVIDKYKGLRSYAHSGGDAGFRSYLLRFPDQHFSIAIASNYAALNTYELAMQIADIYLKDEFKPETDKPNNNQQNQEEKPKFDPSTVKLSDFAGKYYSPELETYYTFELKNDTLISHHQRHDDMKLTLTKADGFNIGILGDLDFYRENGKVAGFRASNGRVRNLKFIRQQD